MTPKEELEIHVIIESIPVIAGYQGPVTWLGGLTNRVYQHRIQGQGTEEYINRAHEAASAKAASKAGVSPEVLYVDPVSGLLVTRLIASVTMMPDGFKTREALPARACGKSTADSHQVVYSHFTLSSSMIDDYLKVISTKDVEPPDGYHDVVRKAETFRKALARKPVPLLPVIAIHYPRTIDEGDQGDL